MATLIVTLTESLKVLAEQQAASAGFSSVDEYIANLIETDDFEPLDPDFEQELLDSLDRGPSIPLTRELLNEIRDQARANRVKA